MKKYVSLIGLLFFSLSAYAMLNLQITEGVLSKIPVAVVPFAGSNAVSDTQNVSSIITNDLRDSGQFALPDANKFDQNPTRLSDVQPAYWNQLDMDDVVIGSVMSKGDHYQVSFALIDVYRSMKAKHADVLASRTYPAVPANQLRSVAHQISDQIYQTLTGTRGIFSTKIAYVAVQRSEDKPAKYQLMVADADGFNPQAILMSSQPIMSPAWSPDGRHLAYVSFEQQRPQIYLSDVYTGSRRLLSDTSGINGAPSFSPDGKQLALVLSRTGSPKIYLKNLATGKLKQLTFGSSIDTEPDFSPDGRTIVFTSDRGGAPQIYAYDLAHRKVSRVTYAGNYNAKASYTPDGKALILLHRDDAGFDIAKLDLTSGVMTALTKTGANESPSIAPNGKMVLFAESEGAGELGIVSIDGKISIELPDQSGAVQEPAWSPFLKNA